MLGFVEEIVLLQLDDAGGQRLDLPVSASEVVLAGAALMELALRNRIDTDLERLSVVDASPTGDAIIDDALQRLAAAGDAVDTTVAALERITAIAAKYRDMALQQLLAKGILREESGRFAWMFRTRRYPVVDDREQREVKARLRQILLTDEIPDPRDIVLICLIDACGMLGLLLTPEEIGASKARVAQLDRMDLIGQEMIKAVAEIRFIVRHASSPAY